MYHLEKTRPKSEVNTEYSNDCNVLKVIQSSHVIQVCERVNL